MFLLCFVGGHSGHFVVRGIASRGLTGFGGDIEMSAELVYCFKVPFLGLVWGKMGKKGRDEGEEGV